MLDLATIPGLQERDTRVRGHHDGRVADCPRCDRETPWAPLDPLDPDKWSCLECAVQNEPGLRWIDEHSRGIGVVVLDIYADPMKSPDTPEGKIWATATEKAIGPARFRREFLCDHDVGSDSSVYPDFSVAIHMPPGMQFDPLYPLWMGFDWGYHHPAVVFAQWINGRVHILTEVLGIKTPIEHFLKQVVRIVHEEFFPGWDMVGIKPTKEVIEGLQYCHPAKMICVGDIAGEALNTHAVSDTDFWRQYGFGIRTRYAKPIKRIEKVRALMVPLEDGRPRLYLRGRTYTVRGTEPAGLVDPSRAGTLLQGFMGEYKFRQDSHGEIVQNKAGPMVDKTIESHLMDALAEIVEHGMTFGQEELTPLADIREGQTDFWDLRKQNSDRAMVGARGRSASDTDDYYAPI